MEQREMKTTFTIAGLGLASLLSGAAMAGPVPGQHLSLTYSHAGPYRAVRVNYLYGADAGAANRVSGAYGLAGILNWTNGMKSFCVQVKEDVPQNEAIDFTFEAVESVPDDPPYSDGMGAIRGAMIRDLYSRWWTSVKAASQSGGAGRDLTAAFQAMIWEISHETLSDGGGSEPGELQVNAISLSLGAMQTNSMTTEAAAYFSDMRNSLGGIKHDTWYDHLGGSLWGLSNPLYQDQIIVVPGAGVAFAAIGLAGIRRRRGR